MARAILPTAGVRDYLGSSQKPFEAIYAKAIYDQHGNPVAFIPIDASAIQSGLIDPARIDRLAPSTVLAGVIPTRSLSAVSADAASGAGDPVARINAGSSLISGTKIQQHTGDPAILDPTKKLLQALLMGDLGALTSDDFNEGIGTEAGFTISKTKVAFYLASAIFNGILTGQINIGQFLVDVTGRAVWNDPANPATGHIVEADGRMYSGSDNYADAPFQVDAPGNVYINDTPDSLSRIDLGAIDKTCREVQPSQAGGQFSGTLTLTPLTRGADIWVTTDGSDPTNVTNSGRSLYTGPFTVDTSGGNVTVKAAATKLGSWGPTSTWVFTTSANQVAAPVFTPTGGYYTTTATSKPITLSSGTPGASIKFTTDGSTPTSTNGTIYSGPINVPRPSVAYTIKAYAFKAGLIDSGVSTATYTIKKGKTGGGGGGGNK